MFFKRKVKTKPITEYKGIPVGIQRGMRFGSILNYYCSNCYYGVRWYDDGLKKGMKKCPKCGSKLNWEQFLD